MTSNNKEKSIGEDLEDILSFEKGSFRNLLLFGHKENENTSSYLSNADFSQRRLVIEDSIPLGWMNSENFIFLKNKEIREYNIKTNKDKLVERCPKGTIGGHVFVPDSREGLGNTSFIAINNQKGPVKDLYDRIKSSKYNIFKIKNNDFSKKELVVDNVKREFSISKGGKNIIYSRDGKNRTLDIINLNMNTGDETKIEGYPLFWLDENTLVRYSEYSYKIEEMKKDPMTPIDYYVEPILTESQQIFRKEKTKNSKWKIRALNLETKEEKDLNWDRSELGDYISKIKTIYSNAPITENIIQSADLSKIAFEVEGNLYLMNLKTRESFYLSVHETSEITGIDDRIDSATLVQRKQLWTADGKNAFIKYGGGLTLNVLGGPTEFYIGHIKVGFEGKEEFIPHKSITGEIFVQPR